MSPYDLAPAFAGMRGWIQMSGTGARSGATDRSPDAQVEPDWVEALYDELLADVLLRRDEVSRELDFLCQALELRAGMTVFDQGCGVGSLALPLAQRGLHLVGIDQAGAYVGEARATAAQLGLTASFHLADARTFVPSPPVDAAFSWWTSWGHADDAGNLAMLQRAAQALKPGGRFVLDGMNVCGVLRDFAPEVVTTRAVARLGGEVELRRLSRVDLPRGELLKTWVYSLPDGRQVRRPSAMRLYPPWQVQALLEAAGFVEVRLLGSMEGEPLALDSPRLIPVARRP